MLLGYGNLIESATLSGGAWTTAYPRSNVATRALAQRARTSTDATTDTKLIVDHGSAATARVLCIAAHNLSAGATVRWARGTTSGGADVADTGAVDAWHLTPVDGGAFQVLLWQGVDTSARYDLIEIDDTTNPDGYVEIGRVFVGPAVQPTYNPIYGLQDSITDLSTASAAESGARWVAERRTLRGVSLVLEALELGTADVLHEVQRSHGSTGEVVYVPDTQVRANAQRYGFIGYASEMSALEYPYYRWRRLPLKLQELA